MAQNLAATQTNCAGCGVRYHVSLWIAHVHWGELFLKLLFRDNKFDLFATQAGLYILQLIDNYAVPYSALFISLFEVIALAYAYGIDRHLDNIHKMMGYRMWPQVYWKYQFKVGVPLMIIVLIGLVLSSIKAFKYNDYEFPKYTEYVGWAITLSSVIMIPLFGLFEVFKVIIGNKTFKVCFVFYFKEHSLNFVLSIAGHLPARHRS